MKPLFTFLLISMICFTAFANDATIDSLKLEIVKYKKSKAEVKRIEALIALGSAFYKENEVENAIKILEVETINFDNKIPDTTSAKVILLLADCYLKKAGIKRDVKGIRKSISTYQRGLSLLKSSENWYLKGKYYGQYGLALNSDRQQEKAIPQLQKAISFFEKNKVINVEWIRSIGNLKGAYGAVGNYEKALNYARKGKELAKKIDNKQLIAMFALSIGESLMNIEQYDLAIENLEEAIKIGKTIDNQFIVALASYYIGSIKMDSKNPQEWEIAKERLDEALLVFQKIEQVYYEALVNKSLAFYYENKEIYKTALLYNSKFLDFLILTEDTLEQGDVYISHGRYYSKLGQLDSARFYFNKALEVNLKGDFEVIKRTYLNLSVTEEKAGNYKTALIYYKQFKAYRDSIFQEEIGQTIGKESVTQDVEGAMNAKQEAELQAEVLASRNNLYLAIALGLLSILIIGGYLFLQLRKTRKQLEIQNIQLENQNTQLTQLNETKDRFFGIIAHDIRGPITSLDGIGEQMAHYLKKDNQERVNLLTTKIDETAKKLTNLLDNLLNWALLQKGTIPYHPKSLNIHEVVQENMDLYQEVAEMKGIELINKVPTGSVAFADLSAVTTIIRNLINNAVKFTPKSGKITVDITTENKKVFININDTGTGISAERLEKIFALNTERQKGTAGEKGSGLGLLLCKDLIELNKGTIQAFSELGKGSKFVFSLPTN